MTQVWHASQSRNTSHLCFCDCSHWKHGYLWRKFLFGAMPASGCHRLVLDLVLSYVELRKTLSHKEIKQNRAWPSFALHKKYPNCVAATERV